MLRFRLPVKNENLPVAMGGLRQGESGYLLASTSVLLLVVIALIGSFAFVMTRNSHFQGNYATGERLADLATRAHYFAQQKYYGSGTITSIENSDILAGMNLPDNFAFAPVANTKFYIEVRGVDAAPLDIATPAGLKAASAYLHLAVRTTNGKGRAPSDDIALQSGASKHGMARIAFYKTGFPAGDICNGGEPTAVRWGPEASACLSDNQANLMFADLKKGDIIVPVWEAALARTNSNAIVRYPQPERADMNVMNANLNMGGDFANGIPGYNINSIKDIKVKTLQATNLNMPNALKPDGTASTFATATGKDITFNGPTTMNALSVYDQNNGPTPMKFNGPTTINMNNMNVVNSLAGGSGGGQLIINSTNKINVEKLGADDKDMVISPLVAGGDVTMGARRIVDGIGRLEVRADTAKLAIAGVLDASSAKFSKGDQPLGLYTARINTPITGNTVIRNETNNLDWTVSSIEQSGATGSMKINSLKVNDCFSSGVPNACPNSISNPGGGGF